MGLGLGPRIFNSPSATGCVADAGRRGELEKLRTPARLDAKGAPQMAMKHTTYRFLFFSK